MSITFRELEFEQEKKMGERSSLRLLHKLVRIISFLLLWQFGSGFGDRSTAQGGFNPGNGTAIPCGRGIPYSQCVGGKGSPYGTEDSSCLENKELPCGEVEAIRTVLDTLGLTVQASSITHSYCNESNSDDSVTIKCKCLDKSNELCHIIEITAYRKSYSGYIHENVSGLPFLESLDLSGLQLYGTIPGSLGNLTNLTTLYLQNNQLTGSIPNSLGNLKNLISLDLSNNLLSDNIPDSLGNLPMLKYLYLDSNQLTMTIPDDLRKLKSLIALDLSENLLCGSLPPTLGQLSNLVYLRLSSNYFTDHLPSTFSRLTNLSIFEVAGNSLSGPIPKYFKDWHNLYKLNLLGNNFEGRLPSGILKMTTLRYLYVSDLDNSGFAIEDANLTDIYVLVLRNCSISGSIPSKIWKWKWISTLDLSFNNLTGEIPKSLDENNIIPELYLTRNMLNGTVPGWINSTRMDTADLSYNNFTNGTWAEEKKKKMYPPNSSTNVTSQMINIAPNGDFLSEMSDDNCQGGKSKYHSLFINSGGEEATVDKNYYEKDTDLSNFYVSDKGNWAYTCSGDFLSSSYNSSDYIKNLSCGVSVRDQLLYEKARLCPVSLTYYGFCLRKGSYTVQLHFAEVVYTNNEDYSSLGKRVFDVYVQGKRERKDFNIKEKANGTNKVWVENITTEVQKHNLLTIHFFWAGKGSIYNPPLLNGPLISAISVTPNFKVGGLSTWKIAVISVGSILAPLLLLAILWRTGLVGDRELREERVKLRGKSYTLKQIIDATRKFSPKMKIGEGHFGIVYKAELPEQVVVAVKKLYPEVMLKEGNEIRNEIFTLKSLEHENLVQLMDGYSKNNLHLLIYEYMEHGSLEQALFGPSPLALDWNARFEICKGIAKGLNYLHEEKRYNIIHGNIKTTNILLDGTPNPTAKLSDFGLAKFHDEENPFLVNKARRTLIYMAPEYALQKPITVKADVYSFGVVLLEIVSGKPNAEYKEDKETVFLLDKASGLHAKERLLELIDEKLSNDYNRKEADIVLNLAMICINQFPDRRPKMSEVLSVLEEDKNIEQICNVATPSTT